MKKLIIYISIVFGVYSTSQAQDVQFSQMIWNKIYLNPAQSGTDSLDNRFFAIYRDQWRQAAVPYMAASFSYDRAIHLKKTDKHSIGVGGHFLYNRAGTARLTNIYAEATAAYSYKFHEQKQRISIGLSAGYGNRSLDPSRLIFTDEGDGMGGETIEQDQMHLFRLVTGVHFSTLLKDKGSFDIGFSVFNPHQPTGTFFNSETVQNVRYSAYTQFNFKLGEKWQLQPSYILNSQAQNGQDLIQLLARYQLNKVGIWFGPGYRIGDAVIGYVAAEFSNFRAGFSYDQNISDFKKATNGIGAFEASLSYAWSKKKTVDTVIFEPVIEKVEEPIVEVEPMPVVVEEPKEVEIIPEKPTLAQRVFDYGQKIHLYFDHDKPSKTDTANYQTLFNNYVQSSDKYIEKYGDEAKKFFDDDVILEFNQFSEMASYMLEALAEGHQVSISIKGFASNVGSVDYNNKLTERRAGSIRKFLLDYEGGVLKPYLDNGKLTIKTTPLGISEAKTNDLKLDPKYAPANARDRRVELTIEKIK